MAAEIFSAEFMSAAIAPTRWLAIFRVYFSLIVENENIACAFQVAENDILSGRSLCCPEDDIASLKFAFFIYPL
jgi:hypothetical protein